MTISPEAIDQLRDELQTLPPKPKSALTARDAVTVLAPEIQAARASGYSLADITKQLERHGVTISASTLGSYLRAIGREAGQQATRRKHRRSAG